jgi:conjugative relaxase-like TrwC/TraI family protein
MVRKEQYHRVFHGFHPITNKPLVQNAGMPDRRPGWEACLSVPKDVSVILSQMLPADRERLQNVNWRAAEDSLRLIEQRFALSRVGKASEGCQYVRVGLVVPMFEHLSARPTPNHSPDPNLHIHGQPLNLGVDEYGHVRALEPAAIFSNQALLSRYFRAALAAGLRAEFGLITEATRNGFSIRGVPQELVKLYSKRRRAILDYLAQRGQSGAAAADRAALATREKKDPLVSRQELFDQWRKTNEAVGFDDKQVARLLRHGPRKPKGSIKRVIREALKELMHQKNHFSRDDLLLRTLDLLPNYGLPPHSVFEDTDAFLVSVIEIIDANSAIPDRVG